MIYVEYTDPWATGDAKRMPFCDITDWVEQQRVADGPWVTNLIAVRDAYNGDTVVSLPDVEREPDLSAPIPALVSDAVDNQAMRAGSVHPVIQVPSQGNPERARTTRRALYCRWHESALTDVQIRRAYRHWFAYGTGTLWVLPDFVKKRARIEVRDPLGVYTDFQHPDEVTSPRRVASIFGRSTEWLTSRYPECRDHFKGARKTDIWDVVEYIDAERIVIGVTGPRHRSMSWATTTMGWPKGGIEIRRWQNRAEAMVPMAMPKRVTLDRIAGQVANMVGIVNFMARMTALDVLAAEKAIFGDMVIMGKDGREPRLLSGRWHDGREGEPNLIADAAGIQMLQSAPGPLTHPVIDRLERAARITGGNPAMNGGELNGALRSGQTVSALAAVSLDPRTQEAQELMARALIVVNQAIGAVEVGYFPRRKMYGFTGWANDDELVEWTPAEDLDTEHNVVTYPFAGADANGITVAVAQAVGAELMSRKSARVAHPWIHDPEAEERHIALERIRDSVLNAFAQQSASGAVPLVDIVRVLDLYSKGGDLVDAIQTAQKEAQARQAATPPPPEPGQGLAPEQTPGLSLPGQGVETAAPPPVPPVQPGVQNVADLLTAMRAPSRAQAPAAV